MASSGGLASPRAQRGCTTRKDAASCLEEFEEAPPGKPESKHTRRYLHRKVTCQVPSCTNSVESKAYFKRYRVCAHHFNLPSMVLDGVHVRWCQQCGRFHPVDSFDKDRRSCRARLDKHNQRRRVKPAKASSGGGGKSPGSRVSAGKKPSSGSVTGSGSLSSGAMLGWPNSSKQGVAEWHASVEEAGVTPIRLRPRRSGQAARVQQAAAAETAAELEAMLPKAEAIGSGWELGVHAVLTAQQQQQQQQQPPEFLDIASLLLTDAAAAGLSGSVQSQGSVQGAPTSLPMQLPQELPPPPANRPVGAQPAAAAPVGAPLPAMPPVASTARAEEELLTMDDLMELVEWLHEDEGVQWLQGAQASPGMPAQPFSAHTPPPGSGAAAGAAAAAAAVREATPDLISAFQLDDIMAWELNCSSAPLRPQQGAQQQQQQAMATLHQPSSSRAPSAQHASQLVAQGSSSLGSASAVEGLRAPAALLATGGPTSQQQQQQQRQRLAGEGSSCFPAIAQPAGWALMHGEHNSMLLPGAGSAAASGADLAEKISGQLTRVSLKLFDVTPDKLAPHVRDGIAKLVCTDPSYMDACVRPGCTHVTLSALLCPGQQQALASRGAKGLAADVLQLGAELAVEGAGSASPAWCNNMLVQMDDQVAVVREGRLVTTVNVDASAPQLLLAHPAAVVCPAAAVPEADSGAAASVTSSRCSDDTAWEGSSDFEEEEEEEEGQEEATQEAECGSEQDSGVVTLLGRNISGSHDMVVCRQQGRVLDLEVVARGQLPWKPSGASTFTQDGPMEWVSVRPLSAGIGLLEFEVQRGAMLSPAAPVLAVPSEAAGREVAQLQRALAGMPSYQVVVQNLGLLMQLPREAPAVSPAARAHAALSAARALAVATALGCVELVGLVEGAGSWLLVAAQQLLAEQQAAAAGSARRPAAAAEVEAAVTAAEQQPEGEEECSAHASQEAAVDAAAVEELAGSSCGSWAAPCKGKDAGCDGFDDDFASEDILPKEGLYEGVLGDAAVPRGGGRVQAAAATAGLQLWAGALLVLAGATLAMRMGYGGF